MLLVHHEAELGKKLFRLGKVFRRKIESESVFHRKNVFMEKDRFIMVTHGACISNVCDEVSTLPHLEFRF